MGLFKPILLPAFNLMAVGTDIAIAFVVVRFLRWKWSNRLLVAIDSVGAPVVGVLTMTALRLWSRLGGGQQLSEDGKLVVAVLLLFLFKALLGMVLTTLE